VNEYCFESLPKPFADLAPVDVFLIFGHFSNNSKSFSKEMSNGS